MKSHTEEPDNFLLSYIVDESYHQYNHELLPLSDDEEEDIVENIVDDDSISEKIRVVQEKISANDHALSKSTEALKISAESKLAYQKELQRRVELHLSLSSNLKTIHPLPFISQSQSVDSLKNLVDTNTERNKNLTKKIISHQQTTQALSSNVKILKEEQKTQHQNLKKLLEEKNIFARHLAWSNVTPQKKNSTMHRAYSDDYASNIGRAPFRKF